MKNTIKLDIKIKDFNGKHYVLIDEIKNIDVEEAINILDIKYSIDKDKVLFDKIKQVFNIAGEELEKNIIFK